MNKPVMEGVRLNHPAHVQHARLLDKNQFRFLFPDARYVDETIVGLTKSLIAIRV